MKERKLFLYDWFSKYRDPITQFKTLQKELKKYSEKLSQRKFAIALTKADSTIPEIVEEFFEKLGIEPTNDDKYGIDLSLA